MNTKKQTLDTIVKGSFHTRQMAIIGVMAAVTCILGPLSLPLPFSPVPISFTNLAIYLSAYVLGWKRGTLSYGIYLFIGLIGIPVFSSFTGGPGKLFGPTGGYLIGFIFTALICGIFIDKWFSSPLLCFLGLLLGTVVCYLFGSIWLSYQGGITFWQSYLAGVIPFIPGDFIKILIALIIGSQIKKRLQKAGLN